MTMMKKMEPVAPQDRPKVIAVSISLAVAVGFLVRNLMGTPTLARSGQPALVAAATPDAASQGSVPSEAQVSSASPDGSPESTGAGGWGQSLLHDPFHPHPRSAGTRHAAASAAAPASQPIPARPAPPAPHPQAGTRLADARPAPVPTPVKASARGPAVVGGDRPTSTASLSAAPVPELRPDEAAPSPAATADTHPHEPPATPDVRVALTGTVGSGNSAVATFRVGEETVFARPQEMVAGWRVVGIQVGQVWISRHNVRRLVLVGNTI
jgi:hypothetical protein